KIAQALQAAGIELDGMPSGLYFTWDEAAQTTDFAAAFPVKSKVEIKGFTTVEMPAGTRLSVDYYGPYEKIAPAHEAIDAYIQRNKWQHGAMAVEEYVTDPGMEPNPAKWLTKVTYPVSK
ncbi:MAG TPA: GyrI-like domain-containing protein, partial [Saprospiraceae bacterium]|nr:GyrI-like domain-containing protein [Saprospiraceae bacterium]